MTGLERLAILSQLHLAQEAGIHGEAANIIQKLAEMIIERSETS